MRNTILLLVSILFYVNFYACTGKTAEKSPANVSEISTPVAETSVQATTVEAEPVISQEAQTPVQETQTKTPKVEKVAIPVSQPQVKQTEKNVSSEKLPKQTETIHTPNKVSQETSDTKVNKSGESVETNLSLPEDTEVKPAFSHAAWDQLLKKYVSASGKVNYKGFKSEMSSFQSYLDALSANPPQADWSRNKIRAYWINAYNAFTVKTILDNYPLKSIMDLGKPWDKAFIKIGGKSYTLNDIEHKILRAKYFDSRIHFAVNCASFSCPKLLNKAFTESNVSAQMGALASVYINDAKHNNITPDKAELSQLFEWYKDDFTKKGSLIEYINKYSKVKLKPDAEISYRKYNWTLNE